jgi:CDP-paratose 2-epimerase
MSGNGRRGLRIARASSINRPAVLITGGAGFIGTNLAHRLLSQGTPVIVFDNLSRPGVERNLDWLRMNHGALLRVEVADIRDRAAVQRAVRDASQVVHLAAQVAVTTSLHDPVHDFDVNARGTLNLLTALHTLSTPPPLLYTSTNKVYGQLDDLRLQARGSRYVPADAELGAGGIDEARPLAFDSPYGCSKGAADQYVLDFGRTLGMRTVVFRMSCVYGPRQFGTEDQGWVAHFLIRALRGEPVTVYGDGRQVRDVLFVDDVVDAVLLALQNMERCSGHAFNIGGGAMNTTSLLELLALIAELTNRVPSVRFDGWRPGDQRYYVSNTRRFETLTGWRPRVSVRTGVRALHDWLVAADVPAILATVPAVAAASRPQLVLAAAAAER